MPLESVRQWTPEITRSPIVIFSFDEMYNVNEEDNDVSVVFAHEGSFVNGAWEFKPEYADLMPCFLTKDSVSHIIFLLEGTDKIERKEVEKVFTDPSKARLVLAAMCSYERA